MSTIFYDRDNRGFKLNDIELEGDKALRISCSYNKASVSWSSGRSTPSGYYVTFILGTVENNGSYTVFTHEVFGKENFRFVMLEAPRFNAKTLDKIAQYLTDNLDILIQAFKDDDKELIGNILWGFKP